MENQPLISVIIPCFNVENYLEQCINSVIGQTYSNIEIILIDDGSTDSTPVICDQFAQIDSRIHVIHKRNSGASQARNTGLEAAKGEYIMFVDGDDWIDHETCDAAIKEVCEHQPDVVIWSYVRELADHSKPRLVLGGEKRRYECGDVSELHRRLVGLYGAELAHPEHIDSFITVWGKLYRRNVLADYRFIDMSEIGTEDIFYNVQVFGNVRSAVYLPQCYNHYRKTNANSLSTVYTKKIFNRWKNLYRRIKEYLDENHLPDTYYQALENRICLGFIGLGTNLAESHETLRHKFCEMNIVLNDPIYRRAITGLDFTYLSVKWKLFFYFAKHRNILCLYLMLCAINMLRRH